MGIIVAMNAKRMASRMVFGNSFRGAGKCIGIFTILHFGSSVKGGEEVLEDFFAAGFFYEHFWVKLYGVDGAGFVLYGFYAVFGASEDCELFGFFFDDPSMGFEDLKVRDVLEDCVCLRDLNIENASF